MQRAKDYQDALEETGSSGLAPPDIKTYYKATETKTMWFGYKYIKGRENTEISRSYLNA